MSNRFQPPTHSQHDTHRERGAAPSFRLRDEKASATNGTYAPVPPPAPVSPFPIPTSWWKRHLIVAVFVMMFSVPAYFLASRFIVTAVVVQGRSMTPTLKDGERYYLNRWRYIFLPPQRGDIVVIKDPGHNDFAVKRIVGRPYDWLNLKDGILYLNGKRVQENYLDKGVRTDTPDLKERWVQLGRDQYYVLGDNRANSEDSRFYGVVLRENIIGMVIR
ncbi:MAG TPA: signal peptidase I [Candidatus Saccharimonadales bacterium]|jgi:signal peptidase I|nr:signal peptidase I [Candidatus Saccharimonadales bacterium]